MLKSDSFDALAMPLFDQLYDFAHALTRTRTEAEDLVQETASRGAFTSIAG
jgi:RNA polymerase sigma-70 factor (ECF subfamily)